MEQQTSCTFRPKVYFSTLCRINAASYSPRSKWHRLVLQALEEAHAGVFLHVRITRTPRVSRSCWLSGNPSGTSKMLSGSRSEHMPASSNPPAWDGVDFRLNLGDSEDKLCQVVAYAVQLETYLAQARQSQEPATALAGKRVAIGQQSQTNAELSKLRLRPARLCTYLNM